MIPPVVASGGRIGATRPEAPAIVGPDHQVVVGARLVLALVVAIVALQRLALPFGGGQIPLVLPVIVGALAWGAHRKVLCVEPVRRQFFLVTLVWCAGAAAVVSWRGLSWSPLSIIYLAVTYVPFVFRLRRPTPGQYHAALLLFLRMMTFAAVVGIAQVALQLVGVPYVDPFSALPSTLVLQGYQNSYPVVYGSGIFKANGIVFLEPSFYSQFLALALVIHAYLRRGGVGGYLLMAGIVASVSGTGIILLVVGILALGVTERRRQLARMAVGVFVVAFLVAISPAGSIFTSRIDESSSSTSSARGRFSVPYALSVATLSADPATLLTGRGPGAAERASRQVEDETGLVAVFPVVPKVAFEYGLPTMAVFLVFILTSTLRNVPSIPLALPLLVMYFVLSGSLLQPITVYTVYAFTSLFAGDDHPTAMTAVRPS